jgi:ABC-type transport system substrate-binding protein
MTKSILVLLIATLVSFGIFFQVPLHFSKNEEVDNKRPQFGGTYKRLLQGKPTTMDPAYVTDTTASEVVTQLFSRLLKMDSNLEIKPDLVTSWDISSDKLRYTFYLKPKVRFHTITEDSLLSANKGREIVADDIRFTFERLLDKKNKSPHRFTLFCIKGAQEFSEGKSKTISGLRIIDDYTFKVTLKYPFSAFLSILTTCPLSVVPKEDVLKWGKKFSEHPVGSGAFIFDGFRTTPTEKGNTYKALVLRSNLDFHRGRAYLDRILFRLDIGDHEFEAFRKKEIYHLSSVDPLELKKARKNDLYQFQKTYALQITYLGMNVTLPPFDNVHVRRALNYAVNKAMIVKYINKDLGGVAKGPLPPKIKEYNPVLQSYSYDPEIARKELVKAGFNLNDKGLVTDFPPIVLQASMGKRTKKVCQAVQANLADLGIKLKLKFLSLGKHYNAIDSGKVPFFSLGWIADYPDADNILYYNFHSHNIGTNNSTWYKNDKVDKLLVEARACADETQRKKLYQETEKTIVEDAPWIFLNYPSTHMLIHPHVQGIKISPLGVSEINYHNVWLKRTKS